MNKKEQQTQRRTERWCDWWGRKVREGVREGDKKKRHVLHINKHLFSYLLTYTHTHTHTHTHIHTHPFILLVPLSAVTALRRPEAAATSLPLLTQALDLLLLLHPAFLRSLPSSPQPEEEVEEEAEEEEEEGRVKKEEEGREEGEEEERRVGCLQVESDVQGRLQAIAALGIGNLGIGAMPLLQRVQEATATRKKKGKHSC